MAHVSGTLGRHKTKIVQAEHFDMQNRIVTSTATALSITKHAHDGKTVVLNATAPFVVTLPEATGSGSKFRFYMGVAATGTASTIKALSTDIMVGRAYCVTTTSTNAEGFATSATSDHVTFNGTTTGGVVGDTVVVEDIKDATWSVLVFTAPTGTEATPFAAT